MDSSKIEFCEGNLNANTGLMMIYSDHCTMYRNQFSLNSHGMHFVWSDDFWIIENKITQNTKSGIWLLGCDEDNYRWDSFKIYNSTILENNVDVVQQNTMIPSSTVSFYNQIDQEITIATNTSIRTKYYSYTYRITIEDEYNYYNDIYTKIRSYSYLFLVEEYDTPRLEYLINHGIQTSWGDFV